MIYFHSFRSPGLVLDIVGDIRALNELSRTSIKAGMIILGGGVCKHQIANAMLIVRIIFLLEQAFLTAASVMGPTILCSSYAHRSACAPLFRH
jgi:deoxyhypusine synthase